MAILSIQSHVSYGYVGNRAATFPLQSLGYEVWTVNTVNFSNHTGYGKWQGQVLLPSHVREVISGIQELGVTAQCEAILTGYVGDPNMGEVILDTVKNFSATKPDLLYLCDPVMGDVGRGFFVKEGILEFFRDAALKKATIITPNHFEAEALWGQKISTLEEAKSACQTFHKQGVKIVIITSLICEGVPKDRLAVLLSTPQGTWLAHTPHLNFTIPPNGTGDLFSALYLGNFLSLREPTQALRMTLASVYKVVKDTYDFHQRELCLLRQNYAHPPTDNDSVIFEVVSSS